MESFEVATAMLAAYARDMLIHMPNIVILTKKETGWLGKMEHNNKNEK